MSIRGAVGVTSSPFGRRRTRLASIVVARPTQVFLRPSIPGLVSSIDIPKGFRRPRRQA
ncbi:MAG TPA: hypothetical protein VF666_15975 [Pyrinomonadaceae bacterium]